VSEEERLGNGVLARAKSGGDVWANFHRHRLDSLHLMVDIDCVLGATAIPEIWSDRVFAEMAPDARKNKNSIIREWCLVALFERKRTLHASQIENAVRSASFQLDLCRKYGHFQPVQPRFFFVVGTDDPFTMHEVGITTGRSVGVPVVIESLEGHWQRTWNELGLTAAHYELREHLLRKPCPSSPS
jgi:hypothetical protein